MGWINSWVFKLRFLKPRWILLHLLVLSIFIALINLGLWQLRRLDSRQDQNAMFQARSEEAPLTELDLSRLAGGSGEFDNLEFRSVQITGEYTATHRESTVRNRTSSGRPGVWAITPFETSGAGTVIVNRGWIPREFSSTVCREEAGEEADSVKPPSGRFVINGILRRAEGRGSSEWKPCLARIELEGFSELADVDIDVENFPFWIQIREVTPQATEGPLPLDSPDRGNGPHLSYAVQWFIFSAIFGGGYPLILIRQRFG